MPPEHRDIVMESIQYMDGKKYVLYAAVILPDHFHLIIQPMEKGKDTYYSLSEIMHGIKSFTAHTIGEPIWQHENFDRIIRDKEELFEKDELHNQQSRSKQVLQKAMIHTNGFFILAVKTNNW